jgi:LAO/AO transport system kinase
MVNRSMTACSVPGAKIPRYESTSLPARNGPLELVDQVLAGNRRALARAISEVEDRESHANALLAAFYPHTGRAHIIGITGAPGTGKSTLVNALARAYRIVGLTVGIIAVDPTSPYTGGALLGDRVRMRDLTGDAGVFIRSMATRGSLGGLARATGDVILILDAAGFDRVLVETVGVGQAEVDIANAANTTIVVESPDMGDEVQAIKAGVLEIADLFAVNKADREGADRTAMALQYLQGIQATQGSRLDRTEPGLQGDGSWLPPIVKTVATHGEGIEATREWIEVHATYLREPGRRAQQEITRATVALHHILREQLISALLARLPDGQLETVIDAIAHRELDPYTAADRLIACGRSSSSW